MEGCLACEMVALVKEANVFIRKHANNASNDFGSKTIIRLSNRSVMVKLRGKDKHGRLLERQSCEDHTC